MERTPLPGDPFGRSQAVAECRKCRADLTQEGSVAAPPYDTGSFSAPETGDYELFFYFDSEPSQAYLKEPKWEFLPQCSTCGAAIEDESCVGV